MVPWGNSSVKWWRRWGLGRESRNWQPAAVSDMPYFTLHSPTFWKAMSHQTTLTRRDSVPVACYSAVLSTWKSRVLRGISFLPTEGIPALLPQQSLSRWACQIHCFQIWSCLLFAKEGQRYLVDIYLENREGKITSSWCSHCFGCSVWFFFNHKASPWPAFLPAVFVLNP